MAGKSTSEVRIGGGVVGGYAFDAPIGSIRPNSGDATLDAAYQDDGYVSDDGLEIKFDNGADKVKDWNQDTIAIIQKSNEATLTVTYAQVSVALATLLFGAENVAATDGKLTKISYDGELRPHRQYAFLQKDSNGPSILDIGDGQVSSVDGITFKKDEIVSFKTEIELFKDASGKFFNWHLISPVTPVTP